MVSITCKGIKVTLDDETLCYEFSKDSTVWRWRKEYRPRIECEDGIVYFSDAKNLWHKQIRSGVGEGILSHYENFTLQTERQLPTHLRHLYGSKPPPAMFTVSGCR